MSDAALPTVAEVRAAAEAVKAALDRHLAAVESRIGDDDPDVYAAFNELAAAAEEYDELLYDRYDEVTPFEIPTPEDGLPYTGPAEPAAFSVLIRRDYAVVEPARLIAQAERVVAHDREAELDHDGGTADALGVLFGEYEPDEIASRAKDFGLEEGIPPCGSPLRKRSRNRGSGSARPSRTSIRRTSCTGSTSARSSTRKTLNTPKTPTRANTPRAARGPRTARRPSGV